MMDKFLNIFRIPDLRKKLIFTGLLLLVYRLGGKVPIPGIDKTALASLMQGYANTLLGVYDMFAGGFFSRASIFALGIMPYISASIIIQLLGAIVPYFQRLQKEGEEGGRPSAKGSLDLIGEDRKKESAKREDVECEEE